MQVTVNAAIHPLFAALIRLAADRRDDPLLKLVLVAFGEVAGAREVLWDAVNFLSPVASLPLSIGVLSMSPALLINRFTSRHDLIAAAMSVGDVTSRWMGVTRLSEMADGLRAAA